MLVIPIRMLGNTLSLSLSATDRQRHRMIAVAAAATLNVALNVVLIPIWSYLGAAVATIICESSLLVAYAILLRQVAGRSDLLRSLNLPGAATVPMGVAVLATRTSGFLVSAAAGAAVYALAVVALALLRTPRATRRRPGAVMANLVRPTAS